MAIGEINAKLAERLRAEGRIPNTPRGERAIDRTSAGLRNALFDEIDALRRGDGDPQRAMAVAKLAQNILATAKMEHQVAQKGLPVKATPLELGDGRDED